MFNNILFYLVIGLSASTMGFGYLSYSLSNDKAVAEQALVQAIDANTGLQKSLNLKGLSCKIDSASVVEVEAEKLKIDESISPINIQLKELATVKNTVTHPVAAKQETIKDESNFLPDDGLLSPNVARLLHDGWCSVYPSTSECVSTGQLASKSM